MGKLIGIDLGAKRTGIAMTDDLQIIASPLETVPTDEVLPYLERLLASEDIEGIILGEPFHADGNSSEMTVNVHNFRNVLEKKFPGVPVSLEDERFTSKMAADSLKRSDVSRKKRRDKSLLDKISASLILQSYLEKRNL